mgnify:CR=1 FL=1
MKCDFCNSDKILNPYYERMENDTEFTLSKCLECSLIFKTNPKSESIDLLSGQYYKLKSQGNVIDKRFVRHFTRRAEKHYRYITKYYTNQEKYALDIGCGAGFFIRKLKNSGWTAKGIESDPFMCNYGLSHGLEIENILFEDYAVKEKFGLVYLSHIFDDLPKIKKVLIKIKQLLAKGGLLFIEIPNFGWYHRLNIIKYEDLLAGNYFFTRKTLLNTLSLNDFKLLHCETFEPIYINTFSQAVSSPFKLYLKFLPSKMKSSLKAIFKIDKK